MTQAQTFKFDPNGQTSARPESWRVCKKWPMVTASFCSSSARENCQRGILHVGTQHVFGRVPASDTTEDNTIQQGVATQSVVAMDTTCNFSCGIQSADAFPLG